MLHAKNCGWSFASSFMKACNSDDSFRSFSQLSWLLDLARRRLQRAKDAASTVNRRSDMSSKISGGRSSKHFGTASEFGVLPWADKVALFIAAFECPTLGATLGFEFSCSERDMEFREPESLQIYWGG